MDHPKIWIEQCESARKIEDDFGTDKALAYLIGEKFLNYLQAAETNESFRKEIPAFVEKIMTIFERWQIEDYFDSSIKVEEFDPMVYDEEEDDEIIEIERKSELRQSADHLLLVETSEAMAP